MLEHKRATRGGWIALSLLGLLGSSACGVAEEDSPTALWFEYRKVECPLATACGASAETLEQCLRVDDDDATLLGRWQEQLVSSRLSCLKAARSCQDYEACIYDAGACTQSSCDGDTLIRCDTRAQRGERLDCTKIGLNCGRGPDGAYDCMKPNTACQGHPELRCDGDYALYCPGEGEYAPIALNCDFFGQSCDPNLKWCTSSPATSCQAHTCSADGRYHNFCKDGLSVALDCAQMSPDHACEDPQEGCQLLKAKRDCDKNDPADVSRCVGEVAQLCNDGIWRSVDCGAIGAKCERLGGDGEDDRVRGVRCTY